MRLYMSYDQLIQFKEIEIKQHDQKKMKRLIQTFYQIFLL